MDEAWAAQLSNGSVIVFMRNCELANFHDCQMISEPLLNNPHPSDPPALLRGGGPGNHRVAYALSSDGGSTFGPIRNHPDLLTPVCQASAVEYKGSLYFAGPHSTTARMNMTVLASDDSERRQHLLRLCCALEQAFEIARAGWNHFGSMDGQPGSGKMITYTRTGGCGLHRCEELPAPAADHQRLDGLLGHHLRPGGAVRLRGRLQQRR